MKFRNILILIGILICLFIYIRPSITGLIVQDRFLISDVKVSAPEFDQEVKVEQFDEHEIKFDNALYYFTVEIEKEQEINYILIEFIVDSSQIRDYTKDEVKIYYYGEKWQELDNEFVKQDGRFYYYKAKSEKFGLFAVAPKKQVPVVKPLVGKNDLILFGLLPIFIILLFSCILVYGSARLIQRINYRAYLLFKKGFVGLSKFILSFGVVVLILNIISKEHGQVSNIDIIYYAVIPLILLSLLSDVVLNLILYIHRLILMSRVYRFVRNSFWLFILILILVVAVLLKFIPEIEGSLGSGEIILYGLLPVILISFSFVFVLYLFYALFRRLILAR